MSRLRSLTIVLLIWGTASLLGAAEYGLIPSLSSAQEAQSRSLLTKFKANPRGPYVGIKWYCKDGSVLPPGGNPCKPLGGGIQHAVTGPEAKTLAQWNIDVGTILAAISYDEFLDTKRDHHRLKELVLEKFLVDVDDGWVYRKARFYRGARQAEDEEKTGREYLVKLLSDPAWTKRNYLLAAQLIEVVPHGLASGSVKKVRTLAQSIAEADPRFQPIRIKIHSQPGREDLAQVEKFITERQPKETVLAQLQELATLLKQEQRSHLAAELPAYQKKLADSPLAAELKSLSDEVAAGNEGAAWARGAAISFEIRKVVTESTAGKRNLDLLNLNSLLQEKAFQESQNGRKAESLSRRGMAATLLSDYRYATGAGLLSFREFDALRGQLESMTQARELNATAWASGVRYLARSSEWCRASVAEEFGPVSRFYSDVEPKAGELMDHLLRGSVALPLSARIDRLVSDANRLSGIQHAILNAESTAGVRAMNPGIASGKLGIVEPGEEETAAIDPQRIYVIPETLADLKPMAGILTLDSGNALSHSQLLAANLGIPNATVPSALLPVLRKYKDHELFYAVTQRGVVVLKETSNLTAEEKKLWPEQTSTGKPRIELNVSKVNLTETRLLPLSELNARDSGVKAGPKASNLGQLAHFFPEDVAPGLVVPFGVYYEHINRPLKGGSRSLREEIVEAHATAEKMRDSGVGIEEIRKYIYPKLAEFRKAIQTMPLLPSFETGLREEMKRTFGPDGTYGVFVRSDTNAEDLPEFTGAGLNLTVPNQVGTKAVLQALKDVWASPFEERAYDWRSRILKSSEQVYPSVLLLRTVPSDKSGVIGTMNLETGNQEEITVNVSEGTSAVVDGGVAESLLLRADGTNVLLQQARNPYRKVVTPTGGFENMPVAGGDYLLNDDEIRQLRKLVAEVKVKYPKAKTESGRMLPWDIEFGFEKGQLRLFQIRPLVRYETMDTEASLEEGNHRARVASVVKLDERPLP